MKAPTLSAASQATQRSAARRGASFLREEQTRLSLEDREAKARTIVADLERALAMRVNVADFNEVAGIVLAAPGVESCLVQQTAHLDKTKTHGSVYRDLYRVYIQSGEKHYEAQNADLATAVREAFAALKIDLPKGF